MIRFLGKLVLVVASTAFMIGAVLFLFGTWLVTWPIMRKHPRTRQLKAVTELVAASVTVSRVFSDTHDPDA